MYMPRLLTDSFFNDFMRPEFTRVTSGMRTMETDVLENENGYELQINLPGYKKENLSAELKDGYLTVTASDSSEKEEKDEAGKYLRRERFCGSMKRSFYVGDAVSEDDIKASFENGVLKIGVPKMTPAEPEKKLIAIA